MLPQAKTIQIYLPSGNPRGLRVAEVTASTVKVIEIPRVHIKEFLAMPESAQPALYFLVSSNEEDSLPRLYIGQTDDLRNRLKKHNLEKDFWERAFAMFLTNNTLTKTHALYLEYKSIEKAKLANRYNLENCNGGSLSNISAATKSDCDYHFYLLNILLSTLGQPIFEELQVKEDDPIALDVANDSSDIEKQVFKCTTSLVDARGYYDNDGFVILKDSLVRKKNFKSLSKSTRKIKRSLIYRKKLVEHNSKFYVLTENYLCKTPTVAAALVLGRSANGWSEWINDKGETLDTVYRQNVDV